MLIHNILHRRLLLIFLAILSPFKNLVSVSGQQSSLAVYRWKLKLFNYRDRAISAFGNLIVSTLVLTRTMVIHYIRVALRNLERQKALAFINILGLSIGLACFTLFLLYAVNEFSYDRFHTNASNIYKVYNWKHLYETDHS